MSVHRCKFNDGNDDKHDSYLVIFKVHGADAINLWPTKYQNIESIANPNTCHNVHNHDEFYAPSDYGHKKTAFSLSSSPTSSFGGSISSLLNINNSGSLNNLATLAACPPLNTSVVTNPETTLESSSIISSDEDYNTDTESSELNADLPIVISEPNDVSEDRNNINSENDETNNATIITSTSSDANSDISATSSSSGNSSTTSNNHHIVENDVMYSNYSKSVKDAPEIHYNFRHACHNDEVSDLPDSDEQPSSIEQLPSIQSIVLEQPARKIEKCVFQDQAPEGTIFSPNDLTMFITKPMSSTERASFAVDLSVSKHNGQNDLSKVGTAYIYLDPKFSTLGIQRTPIIGTKSHAPIGQIQIEYIIVTNPVGFGVSIPNPKWLNQKNMIVGHRGSGSGRRLDLPEPLLENTVASFNYAHRHGADMCELDVLVSADGVPVVYHDFDVDAVTAQQSSEALGKFRIQVNEFTMKQLREFSLLALEDADGTSYTLNIPNQTEQNRPFPTLAEVLDKVDQSCGLSIEVKWPQMLETGCQEAKKYREINNFVERVINVLDRHAKGRRVILESFDADLVIMLRLKQTRFPVFFVSQGMSDRYERYFDPRTRSIRNGIYFAQAFGLAGVDLINDYYYLSGKKLVNFINSHGLIARGWGALKPGDTNELKFLKQLGLQSITCDFIDKLPEK